MELVAAKAVVVLILIGGVIGVWALRKEPPKEAGLFELAAYRVIAFFIGSMLTGLCLFVIFAAAAGLVWVATA